MATLTIKNCSILKNNNLEETNIHIKDGKISEIGKYIKAKDEIDAKGLIAIPGIIDPHVHFREPGMEWKEDFLSGSRAAAKGGVTTILDMPNTSPPTMTVNELNGKRELAEKSIVNYGFHFGSSKDNIPEIKKAENIASTKLFMDISTGGLVITDELVIRDVFRNSKIVAVHAEGGLVKKAIELSKKERKKLYLCHISLAEEIKTIREEKDENIFVEVTPHHLFMTEDDVKYLRAFALMKPTLKTKKDQDALWKAIGEGIVDTIGTDHAPHTQEEKISAKPPFGVPGVETMLPLMLNAVNEGRLTLQRIVQMTSENPAKIFGIENKGKLKKGYDADITLVDMEAEKEIVNDELLTKCGWSPFNGRILKGWPVITIVNGNIVYNHGDINGNISGKEVKFK